MKIVSVFIVLISLTWGKEGFGPGEQDWGFITVREQAQLFWWLYYTTAEVSNYNEKPLVIWLQGGPGASSTGYGNFAEIGPLDVNLVTRNTTWVKNYNVLFVDNPVGTGFSYTSSSSLATNNTQIAYDFVAFLKSFYESLPDFKNTPLYIFSESYGGKMTAEIALKIDEANKKGDLKANLVGIGLGDSWISPLDSVLTWGEYLLNLGFIDDDGLNKIQKSAVKAKEAFEKGDYEAATEYWGETEMIVSQVTSGVDFYNVLKKFPGYYKQSFLNNFGHFRPSFKDDDDEKIDEIMNNDVKSALGIAYNWGEQSNQVFGQLYYDFMKPVTDIVEQLLNSTDIKVAVYNGQLDLIVDTPGTYKWVKNLEWEGKNKWDEAKRSPFSVDGIYEGYVKKSGNLAFYWVNRAGHMVPADNTQAMSYILKDVIS